MSVNGIPFLLYSTGSGTAAPPPPPDPTIGQTILMPGKAGPSGSVLTRKRFQEIMAAERALEAAELRVHELKTSKQKAALNKATVAAQAAIEAARADETELDLARVTASLEAAANATKTKTIIEQANAAYKAAQAFIADMEDEEEAVMLLLH